MLNSRPRQNALHDDIINKTKADLNIKKQNNHDINGLLKPLRIHPYYNRFYRPNEAIVQVERPTLRQAPTSISDRKRIDQLKKDAELNNMTKKIADGEIEAFLEEEEETAFNDFDQDDYDDRAKEIDDVGSQQRLAMKNIRKLVRNVNEQGVLFNRLLKHEDAFFLFNNNFEDIKRQLEKTKGRIGSEDVLIFMSEHDLYNTQDDDDSSYRPNASDSINHILDDSDDEEDSFKDSKEEDEEDEEEGEEDEEEGEEDEEEGEEDEEEGEEDEEEGEEDDEQNAESKQDEYGDINADLATSDSSLRDAYNLVFQSKQLGDRQYPLGDSLKIMFGEMGLNDALTSRVQIIRFLTNFLKPYRDSFKFSRGIDHFDDFESYMNDTPNSSDIRTVMRVISNNINEFR